MAEESEDGGAGWACSPEAMMVPAELPEERRADGVRASVVGPKDDPGGSARSPVRKGSKWLELSEGGTADGIRASVVAPEKEPC